MKCIVAAVYDYFSPAGKVDANEMTLRYWPRIGIDGHRPPLQAKAHEMTLVMGRSSTAADREGSINPQRKAPTSTVCQR